MITELERQFIEVAGPLIGAELLTSWPFSEMAVEITNTYAPGEHGMTNRLARLFGDLAYGSVFLGRVLEANGTTLEIITYAAWQADHGERDPETSAEIKAFALKLFAAITTEALWRGRGETSGPSWTDWHAAIRVRKSDNCEEHDLWPVPPQHECPRDGYAFVIPPLRLAGGA